MVVVLFGGSGDSGGITVCWWVVVVVCGGDSQQWYFLVVVTAVVVCGSGDVGGTHCVITVRRSRSDDVDIDAADVQDESQTMVTSEIAAPLDLELVPTEGRKEEKKKATGRATKRGVPEKAIAGLLFEE